MAVVFLATRIKRVPLPAGLLLAAGGITYPLDLLHMQLGYVIFTAVGPTEQVGLCTAAIISGAVLFAWMVWRYLERPAHRWTRDAMTEVATRLGSPSSRNKAAGIETNPA